VPDEVAKKTELDFHVAQDWKVAHDIWKNAKTYIDDNIPTWVEDVAVQSLTLDAGWHDLLINANAHIALFAVQWSGGTATDFARFYTRKKGSAAAYEGIYDGGSYEGGGMIWQLCDSSGYIQYSGAVAAGNLEVKLIGYWRIG
jgi:hypothetical protein